MLSLARDKLPSNRPSGSVATFQPTPRALPQATPTYAGMLLGTRGCEHARKRARVWSHKRDHFATLQATLASASAPGRTRWPECDILRVRLSYRAPGHARLRERALGMCSARAAVKTARRRRPPQAHE